MAEKNEINSLVDLKALERKVSLLYFQDGLWDLVLGFTWVAFGLAIVLDDTLPFPLNSLFGPILWGIGFCAFLILKQFLTRNRLGIIKTGTKKPQKMLAMVVVTIIAVIATIIILILTILDVLTFNGEGYGLAIIFGLLPIIIFGVVAYMLRFPRALAIGILFGFGLFTNELLHKLDYSSYSGIPMLSAGLIVMIVGVVIFIQFLNKYPSHPSEGELVDN